LASCGWYFDIFGIDFSEALGMLDVLMWLAAFTIVYGSVRALWQTDLKRRLAYSTVSQVSYIILGISLFGPLGTAAGLVHLLHQGIMKVTLFFCAGNYAETLGVHRIDGLDGAGPAHAGNQRRFHHRRLRHDRHPAPGGVHHQVDPRDRRPGRRSGLDHTRAGGKQPAERCLLPARSCTGSGSGKPPGPGRRTVSDRWRPADGCCCRRWPPPPSR
jgi:hypothetical protein